VEELMVRLVLADDEVAVGVVCLVLVDVVHGVFPGELATESPIHDCSMGELPLRRAEKVDEVAGAVSGRRGRAE
jgi:hypothetical protein